MQILKINTGVFNLLLIETVINRVINTNIDRKENTYTITLESSDTLDKEVTTINITDYLDDNSREVRELGLLSLLQEKNFRSLLPVPAAGLNDVKLYFTKAFDSLLQSNNWSVDYNKTLVLRI